MVGDNVNEFSIIGSIAYDFNFEDFFGLEINDINVAN